MLYLSLCCSVSVSSDGETEYTKREKTLCAVKEQLAELENKSVQLNEEIRNKHQALFKGKEERDKLRYEQMFFTFTQTFSQMSDSQLFFPKSNVQTLFVFTRLEERNIQASYESKLKRRNQLLASRSNKLKRFGDHVPELLGSISEAYSTGRFVKKPIGPIGDLCLLCFSLSCSGINKIRLLLDIFGNARNPCLEVDEKIVTALMAKIELA